MSARAMLKNHLKKQVKKELESLGERVGDRIDQAISKTEDQKGARLGKKAGKAVGEQVQRVHEALEKETVTKEEELGVGGKIGTGLAIMGKHLVEKRYGLVGKLFGTNKMVSDGRTLGAKAEKIVKRAAKKGIERLAGAKGSPGKKHKKGD